MAEKACPDGELKVKAAVGVYVIRDDNKKVLLGLRRHPTPGFSSHFALPGGKIEFGESFEECAAREVKEEAGVEIANVELLTVTNDVYLEGVPTPAHFVTVIMQANLAVDSPEPRNMEPDIFEGWDWYDWDSLPKPLIAPLEKMARSGFNPLPSS